MITKPKKWDEVQAFSSAEHLPVGAYVCKVKQVNVVPAGNGMQLAILFDIVEGDYTGYFDRDYRTSTRADKKWRGTFRQWLPNDDGSEKDNITVASLKTMISVFEGCNPGYHWNWEEKTLKDKAVGVLFRNEEWEFNGKTGWAARPYRFIALDKVRDGEYKIPDPKPLKKKSSDPVFVEMAEDDSALPF